MAESDHFSLRKIVLTEYWTIAFEAVPARGKPYMYIELPIFNKISVTSGKGGAYSFSSTTGVYTSFQRMEILTSSLQDPTGWSPASHPGYAVVHFKNGPSWRLAGVLGTPHDTICLCPKSWIVALGHNQSHILSTIELNKLCSWIKVPSTFEQPMSYSLYPHPLVCGPTSTVGFMVEWKVAVTAAVLRRLVS